MRIALYQGKSFISRCIRWQSRSIYSHAAFLLDDGSVIEAWQPVVRHVGQRAGWLLNSLSRQHARGTVVDIFSFVKPLTPGENLALQTLAISHVGTPYDYLSIFRFIDRKKGDGDKKRLFCSEMVFDDCAKIGRKLLERCHGWEIPPRDIARSPLLKFDQSITTT